MVRSSEALGEAIRRTHAALLSTGATLEPGELLATLGADLVDGVLDGAGAGAADPRAAATVSIVSAQVLLEVMANRLTVGGALATGALDASIQQIAGGDMTVPLTGTLNVTDGMLTQARTLVDAAMLVDANPELAVVRSALDTVQAGQSSAQAAAILPADAGDTLAATVEQVVLATDEELAAVNDAVRDAAPPDEPPTANNPPFISGFPAGQVMAGDSYEFVPTAGDADGDALSFAIVNSPAWATFDTGTGRLSGTPGSVDVGNHAGIRISVSDGFGSVELPAFGIEVMARPNRAPTIGGTAPATVTAGNQYEFMPTAADPDGDVLSFSIVGLPSWASFDAATGRVSGTPELADVGVYSGIQITVSDGTDRASLLPFTVTVSGLPNGVPTIAGTPPAGVTVGAPYAFVPTASDPDGDALSFSIAGLPAWASFDPADGRLSGIPAEGDEGVYSGIRISVSDGRDTASLPAFAITVDGLPNAAPTISGTPPTSVTVGSSYAFTPTASDPDGDALSFSIAGRPGWASFSASTGRLSGAPVESDVGSYSNIRISVSDGQASATLPAFTVVVADPPNGAPEISGTPPGSVTVGASYAFVPTASDPDGDALSFSIAGQPAWTAFDVATGRLSGTPGGGDVGTYSDIRISVSDGQETAALAPFAITVSDVPNGAPTITGTPDTAVTVGATYAFTPVASDPDGDGLSFSIAGLPGWAVFDPGTGSLSGTPAATDVGTYSGIRISVSDGKDTASLPPFKITVNGLPNGAPTITGTPPTDVTVGEPYAFTPTASDPDGDALSFSIAGLPAWAAFNPGTGSLTGTPGASDVGVYSGIRISVSDGRDTSRLPSFAITVSAAPNTPPRAPGIPSRRRPATRTGIA
jgi:hypothetical protein